MEKHQHKLRLATIVLLCLLHVGFGLYAGKLPLLACGAVGLVYAAARIFPSTRPETVHA